ncbi:hypothetical protein V1477_001244 [Vespula maculifrons]|uniref:Uncharacterized protein n=1 Tax=Vespula maculifrons TaxID=7453 RepID=A0ABD2D0G0_VESMC
MRIKGFPKRSVKSADLGGLEIWTDGLDEKREGISEQLLSPSTPSFATTIIRLRTDHKDDSLLAEGHCRPLDRAESKWQTVTRLLLGLHTDCELFLLWWRVHSAAKQS